MKRKYISACLVAVATTTAPENRDSSINSRLLLIASTLFIDWPVLIYALWLLQLVILAMKSLLRGQVVVTASQTPDTDTLLLISGSSLWLVLTMIQK